MSSNSFLVLTSKLEPSTVFTSIFGFANRNLSQVFTSILALPIGTYYRFSPAFWLLPIGTYKGFHQHFSTANCTAAVQHCWQTAFKLMVLLRRAVVENFILYFLISVFKSFVSGPDSCEEQFRRMDFISPQEFQRGLTGFILHKTTTAAVLSLAFIIRLIRFRGSVVREQNHSSSGFCLFTVFGTSPVAFISINKTRTDSSCIEAVDPNDKF